MKVFTVERTESKPLNDLISVLVLAELDGSTIYFFPSFPDPLALQMFNGLNGPGYLFPGEKVLEMNKPVLVIKLQMFSSDAIL